MAKKRGRSPRRSIPSKGKKLNLFKVSVDKAAIDRQITNELVGMIMPGENKMVENYAPPNSLDSSGIGSTVIWTAKEGFKVGAEAPAQRRLSFDELIEVGEREKERMAAAAAAHQDAAPEAATNEDQAVIPSMEELVKSSRKLDPTSDTQAYQAFDPALPKEMFDPAIFPAIEQAWKDSNPHGNWRQKKEQGGWVVKDDTGALKFERVPTGGSHQIKLFKQPEGALFSFHTHPNKAPQEARVDGPSPDTPELFRQLGYTVPGIVRSHLGYHLVWPEK